MANMEEKDLHKVAGGEIFKVKEDGDIWWKVSMPVDASGTADFLASFKNKEDAIEFAGKRGLNTEIIDWTKN